jgi:hypothetical protein
MRKPYPFKVPVDLEITRHEHGDIEAVCDRPMTVANLIEALQAMPQDAVVKRYGYPEDDAWTVERVIFRPPGDEVGLW